ncbi:alpha/beta hydrolase [Cyclobacterium amurskyense]|uniref:Lipase, putative esterase n=1 Tax=Cyclobacterium amurskyense TaxID=320787 RepID=A0A0H4PM67_9BACT|nr:alpha/beta hydrolase [Cyclobacterium amurskyense]AKP54140.1 Lipase, putative esterase [Cyclobacterium amurskyense]|tara:strand:- start:2184 stop:3029 length:846 start_codon:yes stop_codon:yes gene_type:complete
MKSRIHTLLGLVILSTLLLNPSSSKAQNHVVETYKIVGNDSLKMDIYLSDEQKKDKPAMVFFFGGGWVSGSWEQFRPHALHFSKKGFVTILVDYRVASRQKTSPFDAIEDAKSAMKYVKKNAERLGLDSAKVIASGGSAGGHLAAATATVPGFEGQDNGIISTKPVALLLFNPVIDNGPAGYGYDRVAERYKDVSPLHNLNTGVPPTLFFLGTKDQLIPVETARYYKTAMEKLGSYCELILYEGQPHGFFNYKNREIYEQTIIETEAFLKKIGLLPNSETE